jgi:hypothetical protein
MICQGLPAVGKKRPEPGGPGIGFIFLCFIIAALYPGGDKNRAPFVKYFNAGLNSLT